MKYSDQCIIDVNRLSYLLRISYRLSKFLLNTFEIPSEFYDSMIKRLSNSPVECNHQSWVNCMKQIFNIIYLEEPTHMSANDFIMKFLRHLADQLNWPLENCDYQSKLTDAPWRTKLIRLLASVNAFLTHQVQKYESTSLSSIKKIKKEKPHVTPNEDDNDIESETSSSVSRQLFEDEDEEKPHPDDNHEEDNHFMQQQHSDLSHLEQELFQSNSLFFSIDKWMESVRTNLDLLAFQRFVFSSFMKIMHCTMKILC